MKQKSNDWRGVIILAGLILAIFACGIITSFNFLLTEKNSDLSGSNTNSPASPQPSYTVTNAGNSATPGDNKLTNGSAGTPKPTQTIVTTPTPSPEQNTADRIRAEMPTGNVVYDPPAVMNLEDTKLVNLILGPNKSVAELAKMIPDKTGRQILDDNIRWYGYMQADMTGTDFDITPVTSAKQLVSKQDITKWSWSIKAKKPGKQTLYLTLYAIVNEDGVEKPLVIRPFDPKVIEVDVTLYQRAGLFLTSVGSHMEWILTGIIGLLIPFAIWLSQRKKVKADDTTDSKDKTEIKNNKELKDSEKLKEDEELKDNAKPATSEKPKKPSKRKPRKP